MEGDHKQIQTNDVPTASLSQEHVVSEKARQVQESHAPSLPAELGPGFVDISGDVGGTGHNETSVDIIAVPCPGADPVWSWTYSHEFYSDASNPSDLGSHDVGSRSSLRRCSRPSPWITRDLRMSASIARVFLYRHRALREGMTLESLSEDLLDQVEQVRKEAVGPSRPLFFIAHSIGGLVVKSALVRATKMPRYQEIIDSCHGVTFFGTPHRGSSYMSTPHLKESIQDLLHLHAPLPQSLTRQVRVNNFQLLGLHDLFVDMASELRLWSFYETQESLLSGSAAGLPGDVRFGAPLVSVKSALLDVWQEDVYAVESDHAHLALFEPGNAGIMESYLADLSEAINKAAQLSGAYTHTPLQLGSHVKVEVIGFYEDPDDSTGSARPYSTTQAPGAETGPIIRLYSTTHSFRDFLRKGPERCLAERLHEKPKRRPQLRHSERETFAEESGTGTGGRNISATTAPSLQSSSTPHSPEIVITQPSDRPPLLGVPHAHTEPVRPGSPESLTSVSTTASEPALLLGSGLSPDAPHTLEYFAQQKAKILIKEHELTGTAAFCRPNPSLRKFVWIHMPFNNPVWVKEIFATIAKTQGRDFSRIFDYDNWVSKQVQNRNSDSQPAYLKSLCKYLSAADRIASPRILPPLSIPSPVGIMPNCLYLYIPYLHFDTYHSMIRRRKLIAKRRSHGRAKPVPKWVAQQDSLELKVIWEYIGYDPPLNCRRTLDQFGHHSLRDTNSRDDDQMLYKLTKKDEPSSRWSRISDDSSIRSFVGGSAPSAKGGSVSSSPDDADDDSFGVEPGPELKNGCVLMIDQLWLWSIDMTTLTTFFSRRESSPTEGTLFQQADLRNSVYNELNGDLTGRTENTLDLAALVVWHAVTVLLDRSSHPDLEIFRIFDEAIGMLAERMTLNMKQFRIHALDLEGVDGEEELEDSDDPDDAEDESPAGIKKRHKREMERSERENRENTSALLELRDLEDELNTLQKLFDTQESTIRQMKDIYTSDTFRDSTKNGQEYLDEALEYLEDYKQQTAEMRKRVETTRNDYEKMLEMVQRQAQVDEVRWSRLQAELAASQNLSVMIFTTFTVIFLPLTFFTGLFGMNTIEWQDERIPSIKEIGAISLPASVLLIVVSLVAAFSYRVQRAFKATYKGFKGSWKTVKALYAQRLEPASRKEAKRKRREEKMRRLREAHRAERNDGNYDFWAMVKRQQRELRYQIPDQNVNSLVSGEVLGKRKFA
ncbi:uncharacterized protein B0T15DRAFT_560288 [Chaetomium strumarium]|uniref:DUF676 domain-containing protein n=1 Tax=Chaetomium strumarium TaxID=1170767 RepID=A0AAJ0GP26_9PEZI|nr:hypothetical protein B0T15DRAFT_560288 [Chaetomium strumarium]